MTLQAFFLATLLMMVLGIGLLSWCEFLVPYKRLLVSVYAKPLLLYFGALYLNVFAGIYALTRRFFLQDTGRKLAHLERQLHSGSSISDELARRLQD